MIELLNRKTAPSTQDIHKLNFAVCQKIFGSSEIPTYYIKSDVDEILRLEFVFNGGLAQQEQKAIASAVSSLLTEGTITRTAKQVADSLDFYGSYIQPRCTIDDAQLTLFCLKKHLPKCLEIVEDVLINPQFFDNELIIYKKNQKQKLKVQLEKTGYLCRRAYYKTVFGEQSPISLFSESGDYDDISRETLKSFHQKKYKKSMKYITASGDVDDSVLNYLVSFSSQFSKSEILNSYKSKHISNKEVYITKANSAQATIRVGNQCINRFHPDYRKLQIVNMILGGYFGSRLMKNIREDKGLTYGIYSVLESYLDDACFYIEADVNSKKSDLAIKEIMGEIQILNNDLIKNEELNTAKNYFLGALLRGIDGPFTTMDRNRILIDYRFSDHYYNDQVQIIKSITPSEIRDLSNKYFIPEKLVQVVCGG